MTSKALRYGLSLALAALPLSPPAWGAWPSGGIFLACSVSTPTVVQSVMTPDGDGTGNVSVTGTFSNPVGSGSTVAGMVQFDVGNGASLSSVTDDKGNSYSIGASILDGPNNQMAVPFYATGLNNFPTAITATFSTSTDFRQITAAELGSVSASGFDGMATQQQSGAPTSTDGVTSGSVAATSGDILYAVTMVSSGATPAIVHGTGFSALSSTTYSMSEWRVVTGSAAGTFTDSVSSNHSTAAMAFKPSNGGNCGAVGPSNSTCLTGTPIDVTQPPYNAKRDGVTDNINAFNQALSDGAASGRPVHIPGGSGSYAYSSDIQVIGGAELYGDGPTTILKSLSALNSAIELTGNKPIVHNLFVQGAGGSRQSNPQSSGVFANSATNYLVQNVQVDSMGSVGFFNGAADTIHGSSFGHVVSNTATNTLADSFHVTNGAHNIEVDHNKTINSGDDEFSNVTYTSSAITHDNNFHDNVGIGGQARGLTLVGGGGNVIFNHNYSAVGSSLANMYIATEPAFTSPNVAGGTFTNNTSVGGGPTHGAIQFWAGNGPIMNVTISGNQVLNPNGDVVQVTGSDSITNSFIQNNNYYYNGSHNDFNNLDGAASIGVSGNVDHASSAYPGDNPPQSIGGVGTITTLACP